MARWLTAIVAALLVVAAGWIIFLNGEPTLVRLSPSRTLHAPLGGALLAAFAAGAVLVAVAIAGRAGVRGLRAWRTRRHVRRATRRAEATARAHELVWHGDYGQARDELLRVEGGLPADGTRLGLLAESYLHEGNPGAARALLERRLVEAGLEPRLLDLLAEAAERMGDLSAAARALERARAAEPESPRLARRLRDVHAAAGRWADALAVQAELMLHLRDPAALATEQSVMRGLRYQAALAETDPRTAVRQLRGLLREDREFVPARVSAGDVLARTGRPTLARRLWERGARRRPDAVLVQRIAALDASEGRAERTTRLYRRLLRRHPDAVALRLLFARHLIGQDAVEEAATVLRALDEPVASAPVTQLVWGELYRRQGHHDQASAAFAQGLHATLDPVAFRCTSCDAALDEWAGYCPACRKWDTARSRAELASPGATAGNA